MKSYVPAVIVVLAVVVGLSPGWRASYQLVDDHCLMRFASSGRIHDQAPARVSLGSDILNEAAGRGRFAPVREAIGYSLAYLCGNNTTFMRLLLTFVLAVTAVLLYLAATNFSGSRWAGAFFAVWLIQCPAANDLWENLVSSETWGMLLIAGCLFCISRAGGSRSMTSWDWISLTCFFLVCFVKEPYLLVGPAFIWLRWRFPVAPGERTAGANRNSLPFVAYGYALIAAVAGLAIFWAAAAAGPTSHGGQSLHLGVRECVANLFAADGLLRSMPENSVWFLPVIAIVFSDLVRHRRLVSLDKGSIVFAILIVIPQLLLYSTRSIFSPRYCFPAVLGLAWLNLMAFRELLRDTNWPRLRIVTVGLLLIWMARCLQIQMVEGSNFTNETLALRGMVQDIVKHIPEEGTIVIVGPPKTEDAAAVLHQIGMLGRPHTKIYLFQPEGSDGDTAWCFDGFTDLSKLRSQDVDCVVHLIPRGTIDLSSDNWYKDDRLVQCTSAYTKTYMSVRKARILRYPCGFEYDLADFAKR